MKAVVLGAVPVLCSMEVSERILVVVHCDLGIARCSGCEEHEKKIIAAGAVIGPGET